MTDSTTTSSQDPAAIEEDIRRTQENMSRTVDKIGDQLTLKNVFNALLDKADENNVDARYLLEGARRNPMALGLIAAGAIWLVSDKDSKFPTFKSRSSGRDDELDLGGSDVHHRDYVSHMSAVDWREGEDETSYQRRRDIARSNFFMCERRPDEDDHSFRQRLDELSEKFREKRRAWMDSATSAAGSAGTATSDSAPRAASRTRDMYDSNPLVGGILAAAVGAALGSTVPVTRQEQEKLGGLGAKVRDAASEQKEQLTSQLREKKDELLEKADEKLQASNQGNQGGQGDSFAPSAGGTGSGQSFGQSSGQTSGLSAGQSPAPATGSQIGNDEPDTPELQPTFDRTNS